MNEWRSQDTVWQAIHHYAGHCLRFVYFKAFLFRLLSPMPMVACYNSTFYHFMKTRTMMTSYRSQEEAVGFVCMRVGRSGTFTLTCSLYFHYHRYKDMCKWKMCRGNVLISSRFRNQLKFQCFNVRIPQFRYPWAYHILWKLDSIVHNFRKTYANYSKGIKVSSSRR